MENILSLIASAMSLSSTRVSRSEVVDFWEVKARAKLTEF